MDSFKPSFEAPYESDYLHSQFEKFWEIRVYSKPYPYPLNTYQTIDNNKTLIRIGRLRPNGEEEEASVQTVEKSYGASGKLI